MRNLNTNMAPGEPGMEPTESAALVTAIEAGRSGTVVRGGGVSAGLEAVLQPAAASTHASETTRAHVSRRDRGIWEGIGAKVNGRPGTRPPTRPGTATARRSRSTP